MKNPEHVLPNFVSNDSEPSEEDFERGAAELHGDHEHVAIAAVKSGILGFVLAAGLGALPPEASQFVQSPVIMTETAQGVVSTMQPTPTNPVDDPPETIYFLTCPRARLH